MIGYVFGISDVFQVEFQENNAITATLQMPCVAPGTDHETDLGQADQASGAIDTLQQEDFSTKLVQGQDSSNHDEGSQNGNQGFLLGEGSAVGARHVIFTDTEELQGDIVTTTEAIDEQHVTETIVINTDDVLDWNYSGI